MAWHWKPAISVDAALVLIEKIYQTLKTKVDHNSNHLEDRQKYSATSHIFNSRLIV